MPIDVLVTISPKPGKEKRVGEILTSLTESIKVTEPDTLNYHSYSTNSDEEGTVDYVVHIRYEEIVVVVNGARRAPPHFCEAAKHALGFGTNLPGCRFKDEEAMTKRRELKHHQDVARYIKDEDLLRRPMRYMKLEPLTGFDR